MKRSLSGYWQPMRKHSGVNLKLSLINQLGAFAHVMYMRIMIQYLPIRNAENFYSRPLLSVNKRSGGIHVLL